MKIYDRNLTGASAAETGRTAETQETGFASNGALEAKGDGDRVELSRTLGRLSRTLSAYAEDRSAVVQTLAERYRSGRYQADSMTIGRAIISETLAGAH
jgi:hypothetical protein